MKILNYYDKEDQEALRKPVEKVMKLIDSDFAPVLSHGWRAIIQISLRDSEANEVYVHNYADVQADEGGGSWAQAKHRALFAGADFTVPLSIEEIVDQINKEHPELLETDFGQAVQRAQSLDDLNAEEIHWLVDTENGPGIAPGYGGIKVPFQVFTYDADTDADTAAMHSGWIMVSFSGGEQWQDLMFCFIILGYVCNAIRTDGRVVGLKPDYEALTKDTNILTFLALFGKV